MKDLLPSQGEFHIEESGLHFREGKLGYAWFRLCEQHGQSRVRAVTFKELTYLPIETRDDPDLLGKQWAALRGLYNADVDFLYTAVGVFQPQHLGVVQFYGAAAEAITESAAAEEAQRRMAAVEATLANYPLSRLRQPNVDRMQLLVQRLERLPKVLAILGHPDPRQTKRGLGRDGALGQVDDDLASQQGEILLRGLAKLAEDFVFLVTAAHIARPKLTQALVKMSQIASNYASRQRGSINVGFSIALPLAAALNNAYSGQEGHSQSQASSTSNAVSEGWGTGETRSWGHSVGKGQSHGIAHTESLAVTDGVSHTSGVSESVSVGQTTSRGHTDSGGHTDSTAHTDSQGHTDSGSHTDSTAHTDSRSHTDSGSHTDSVAHTDSRAHTTSQAQTNSVADTASRSSTTSGATTTSHSTGISSADGSSWSTANSSGSSSGVTTSESVSHGTAHSDGSSWSQGQSSGVSANTGQSSGTSWSDTTGQGIANSVSQSDGVSHGTATSQGTTTGASEGWSSGTAETVSAGHSSGETISSAESSGVTAGMSSGVSQAESQALSVQAGESSNWSSGTNNSSSTGMNAGVSAGVNGDVGIVVADVGVNAGVNAGVSSSETSGTSASAGGGESMQAGVSASVSTGANMGESQTSSWGSAQGTATSSVDSTGSAVSISQGTSGSQSSATSAGSTVSDGTSHSTGSGTTISGSESHSAGGSSGVSSSSGNFASESSSVGGSSADTTSTTNTSGVAHSNSNFNSTTNSVGGSHTDGRSESWGTAQTSGWAETSGTAHTVGRADTRGTADTVGTADTRGSADTRGWADSTGTADTRGSADTRGWADSVGTADTRGSADTKGWADSTGVADSVGRSSGWFSSSSTSHSVTKGQADSESWTESVQESWSEGKALSKSHQIGRSHGTGQALGEAFSMAGGHGFGGGFSAGMVPGVSIGRSWQTEDDVAIRLTELTRGLESLLNQASMEGGFMTTALLFVGETGERAAAALAPQAFHGPNVPTPVLTVPGDDDLRLHALAFRPSLLPTENPFGVDLLWTRWGTLLTPGMLAAYTAPNLFEEGTATTIQEKLPPLAFYPELSGDVILGHLVSPETGDLTRVPLKLARNRHFHTAFVGDTGYGKSVAAERMVYESTLHWHLRTIVLDFGAGWRKLLNAPGLENHVEIRQLSPGGVRPLRWNPLQIGRVILPEVQWRAFCDIFGAIAKLGVRRQVAELREALRRVYLRAGVLVDDPECRNDPTWGRVRQGEEPVPGTTLGVLTVDQRQRLAVERSKAVGLSHLYDEVEAKLRTVPPRDSMLRGVLEGILFRLHPLVQGAAASQYAPGHDAVDLNELVPGDFGVAVLEGGAFLDDFSKAVLLGWAAWHLYTDAVIRRMRHGASDEARIQIVFEEANKILAGLDNSGGDDEGSGASTAEQFANMWRDSRKYGIWLHLITQSPSLIPPGILSSCNNILVGQVKNARDRDMVIAALHRSEKGFIDETWRRFLASLPIARSVAKLGYSFERSELEPCYLQPLPLSAPEPSDEEIVQRLGQTAA